PLGPRLRARYRPAGRDLRGPRPGLPPDRRAPAGHRRRRARRRVTPATAAARVGAPPDVADADRAGAAGSAVLRGQTGCIGAVTAVDAVDLSVAPGSFTALLGPSGCGKTTVLRLVAGFAEPDAGTVHVGGRDVTCVPPDKRGVGLVFQDYALFPHMSVRRN